ncbi:MAG TPA: hypothetical protein ENN61_00570 [Bacteroidaceae bacterium]|nr:hypothetical protein [Bacteroidaceae bacterium]
MKEYKNAGFKGILTIKLIIVFALSVPFISCERTEGSGGTGNISGTLVTQFYNDDYSLLVEERPAADEEIFIVYGDQEVIGQRLRASNTGKFLFNFLRSGSYTIFYLSEDSTTKIRDDVAISLEVQLGNGEDKDLGKLVRFETLDWDDGDATIRGVVKLINYKNESQWPNLVIKDISFAQEQEVYLIYGNHTFYDERIRTQYDGTFEFNNLIPGDYKIFLYSEDVTGGTEMITIMRYATITEREQVVDLGEITIEKH